MPIEAACQMGNFFTVCSCFSDTWATTEMTLVQQWDGAVIIPFWLSLLYCSSAACVDLETPSLLFFMLPNTCHQCLKKLLLLQLALIAFVTCERGSNEESDTLQDCEEP